MTRPRMNNWDFWQVPVRKPDSYMKYHTYQEPQSWNFMIFVASLKKKDPATSKVLGQLAQIRPIDFTRGWHSKTSGGARGQDYFLKCLIFAFSHNWQGDIFKKRNSILLIDSTHNTCYSLEDRQENSFLYTLLLKHDFAGCGIPVAFVVTNSEFQRLLASWLE